MLDESMDSMTLMAWSVVVLVGAVMAVSMMLRQWAEVVYADMLQHPKTACDIDSFVNSPPSKLKVCLAHKLRMGARDASLTPIPLECTKSTHVKGLYVSRNVTLNATDSPIPLTDLLPRLKADGSLDTTSSTSTSSSSSTSTSSSQQKKTVIVATIRMGFGHHRLAYSACSWALEQGYTTIFHDLLNIESDESQLIHSVDALYSQASRWASELGGPVEQLWGKAMKQGDANALRIAALTAAHLQPLLLAYPKDIPLVCTHQLVALCAAAAGFTNVVNLVVDNYPQWFLVVPQTLNLTQGPVNYQSFLRMGVQPKDLKLAGHWCPNDLVHNIPMDCQNRIARAKCTVPARKPRRLLIPVGGAGAQRKFIVGLMELIQDLVKTGQLQLFLNAGDHEHMKAAFVTVLDKCQLDYDTVTTTQGVYDFQKHLLTGGEPTKAVTLFCFDDYFPAVATTDILCRVSDVLTCKPSELAFYPIPKLHIRRVGDHEADSARRAAEAGDGTLEARELADARHMVQLLLHKEPDLLVSMNEAIVQNNTIGMYSGCENAVKWAVEGGSSSSNSK
jgi:hypothetical protein